jgi:hypothetical protein
MTLIVVAFNDQAKQRKIKMASLAEIRAKLAEMENRGGGNNSNTNRDNSVFPHWNIPEGSTARIRFLPDGDNSNMFFWVERAMIRLPFAGIKGQMNSKPVIVQVPCMEMYNETCPILTEVRGWFKDKSLEEMGRKYWKKRSYLFQGFVRESTSIEDSTPENPIRRFVVSPSIFPVITAVLKDTEVEEMPTDYDRGLDFSITKTTKGQYADYSTSKWARKESALNASERAAIDSFGLFNLKDFLPKKPGETEVRIIKEMFEASVDGATYDSDRWGQYYKPPGAGNSNPDADDTPAPAPRAAPVAAKAETAPWEDNEPVASAPVVTDAPKANPRAEEILAMIRSRKS